MGCVISKGDIFKNLDLKIYRVFMPEVKRKYLFFVHFSDRLIFHLLLILKNIYKSKTFKVYIHVHAKSNTYNHLCPDKMCNY